MPGEGIEPPTFGLQNRCSTAELTRLPDVSQGYQCRAEATSGSVTFSGIAGWRFWNRRPLTLSDRPRVAGGRICWQRDVRRDATRLMLLRESSGRAIVIG